MMRIVVGEVRDKVVGGEFLGRVIEKKEVR